jgi:hypothetical protein
VTIEWMPAAAPQLAYGMAVVLGAGVVRGFAGFGFSALTVAGMSLYFSPAQVVPAVFVLEVLAAFRCFARSGAQSLGRLDRC